ncbi:GNAT family N-acetyltransferase [Aureimonas frigidaquae]|uniref:GNAT family N-acetyltransferase n=1 Tax=Aureimonas frigidaquae TaxID=424757 RepID=A0A0P0Z2Z4_9HYPH|nr:GNAT family N-acetyltransferase [Aureimonas frigidaquae]BAT28390.1 hypothetical protein [Aureimonas frigidaquae]
MNAGNGPTDAAGTLIRAVDSVTAVPSERWDELAAGAAARPNPFVRHAFLKALEDSGCVGAAAGWLAQHLVVEGDRGVIGVVPAYLKSHSQGEYVFDHGWADAFERAGGEYYPKLQVAAPFTPAMGPRLLAGAAGAELRTLLAAAVRGYVDQTGASSAHATFLEAQDREALAQAGFLDRSDIQFHFMNRGYASYEEFLASLSSRKRKALRKERAASLANGLDVEWLTGSAITEEALDAMFSFYMDTGGRKWGRPYLNRQFFGLVAETMGDQLLLIMARRAGRYIAGALNFIGVDRLYGRYWGCSEDHPFLHFELCYHQAIDYALAKGLAVVEAGAQGEHKLARGYEPVLTHSAHYIAHPGLRRAVADYLTRENRAMLAEQAALADASPFRQDGGDGS